MACTISTCCSASSSAAHNFRQLVPSPEKYAAVSRPIFLRLGGSGGWRRLRGCRSLSGGLLGVIEINLRGLTRAGLSLEVRIVTRKARHAGDKAVGEQRDVG